MIITKVSYRRLVSDGNFNNESHGAEAVVMDGDDPLAVHGELIQWVDDVLRKRGFLREEERQLEYDVQSLRMKHGSLMRDCEVAEARCKKMVEFLEAHGISIPESDLPF